MAHHFAKFMASPQFNHNCDGACSIKDHHKQESLFEKIIKKVVRK